MIVFGSCAKSQAAVEHDALFAVVAVARPKAVGVGIGARQPAEWHQPRSTDGAANLRLEQSYAGEPADLLGKLIRAARVAAFHDAGRS